MVPESLWDEETGDQIAEALAQMARPVQLLLFVEDEPCEACRTQQTLLDAVAALSDRLSLRLVNSPQQEEKVETHEASEAHETHKTYKTYKTYAVERFPATLILGQKDYGIRFYGVTAGQEFASFLEAILMVSRGRSGLPSDLEAKVRAIQLPVHIQVFVTLTCPYCARMVHTAHQFAYLNDHIEAEMIESSQFLDLADAYQVDAVPKTIINDATALEGAHPPTTLYRAILQTVDPEAYERLEDVMEDARGLRDVHPLREDRIYNLIIIGAGPAALSAALYAARKKLSVGLLAEKWGGQLTYTAQIDNYLGLPGVGGNELLERFQRHATSYPLEARVGARVTEIEKANKGFLVLTSDDQTFAAQAIIYCAGKEYLRLGVPNEERFLGHGIAFCATCDAPLYTGRQVAVVGGANSAFTAVRDLLGFASRVHLIHRRETFTADRTLLEQVRDDPKVSFHTPYRVLSFAGDDRLTGVEILSLADGQTETLEVDGVFLEIGLAPNSEPVQALVTLNEQNEIPVNADGSTSLPGFFAAGDVTDVPEKQVTVAVGQGTLAALAAYEYLVERGLVARRPDLEAGWG